MSIAAPLVTPLSESLAWRLFVRALVVAAGIILLGCTIYAVEKYAFAPRHRFVENPVEIMMRAFGFAHFLVGWLFLLTSPRLRTPRAMGQLAACVGVGLLPCLIFLQGGGSKSVPLLLAFYSLFLFHDSGDQIRLCLGRTSSRDEATESTLRWFFTLLAISILVGMLLFTGYWTRKSPVVGDWPAWAPTVVWGGVVAAATVAGARWHARARNQCGSFAAYVHEHRPVFAILGAQLAILTVGSLFGMLGLNIIILLHVTTWLVHVHAELRKRPAAKKGIWNWVRRTSTGFVALHVGVAAAILILLALRVQLWERSGMLAPLLSAGSFPFWSMLHIATSFWRPK